MMKPVNFLLTVTASVVLLSCNQSLPVQTKQTLSNATMQHETKTTSFTTSGYADVNGINMYYELYGEGAPLVLIHGGGSTIETSFGRIIPSLSKSHRVIAVELQAHGRTSDRDKDLSFEQDADDVAALLKNLDIAKADVFGFSNGANTALQLAVRHPGCVNKIVLASALLKRDGTFPDFWTFMKNGTFEQMPQQYKDAFLKVNPDSAKLYRMFERSATRMKNFQDVPDGQIRSVKGPVLLVNGDADVASSEHMVKMAKLIPNCQLAIIPGGHGEYMGEITTLKGKTEIYPVLPILEKFLNQK